MIMQKSIETDSWRRESFMKFADEACAQALPTIQRPSSRASSIQFQSASTDVDAPPRSGGRGGRGYSIDRDLTNRISTLMVAPEERGMLGSGSGASSLRSSMLHLDLDEV